MKILLIGYGAMNERVARLAEERDNEIVGVVVKDSSKSYPYPAFESISEAPEADVAIDFSNPELLLPLLEEDFTLPLVIATTGEKEQIIEKLKEKSQNMPVFFSANMSYGVHILKEIIQYAVPLLEDFDIEMLEKHHNKKVDAPSGTLVQLYDAIKEKEHNLYQFMIDMNQLLNVNLQKLALVHNVVVQLLGNIKYYLLAMTKRLKSHIVRSLKISSLMAQLMLQMF